MPPSVDATLFFAGALVLSWTFYRVVRSLTRDRESIAQLEEKNQQLRADIMEAETTTRAKSEFLANMSHEIRTPLTSILGYADLLLRTQPEEQEKLKSLRTIRRNGQHLLQLINDVLDISKIEAGEMTVELLECSPWQLVREVRSLLRSQAQAKDLGLEIEAAGPIPEYIRSDPVRLRQILLNLVGNAIKFTETGKVGLVVQIEDGTKSPPLDPPEGTKPGKARLRFDVIDTGIGMTEEQQKNLFLPFRQASESTTRLFGGTGLGLTISQRLAHMLGGDIRVRSVAGEGSTFSLTVDAGTVETGSLLEGPLGSETDQLPVPTGTMWNRRLGGRILLAEDGIDNRRFIAAILQQVGADVTLVENGQQAVARALEARDLGKAYDAVLMDMQMPVLDGYGAAKKLREEGYEGTIVALTAYAMSGDREKCLEAGCDDFVAKPIDVEQFLASLAGYVRGTTHLSPSGGSPGSPHLSPSGGSPHLSPSGGTLRRASRPSRSDGDGVRPSRSDGDGVRRPPALLGDLSSASPSATEEKGAIVSSLADHPTLGKLVEGFVNRLPERLEEIQSAFRDSDVETLRHLAHGLRGAGGTYGFQPLTDAAEKLEQQLVAGAEHATIAAAVDQLTDTCQRVST